MAFDFSYALRKETPGTVFRELDDVELLTPVRSDEGDTIAAGARGTIVGIGRERFIVEFAEPEGALASVAADVLRRVGRHAR
jgi:hypothetical protein